MPVDMSTISTQGLAVVEQLKSLAAEIAEIDTKLGTEGLTDAAKRKLVASSLIASNGDAAEYATEVVSQLPSTSPDEIATYVSAIRAQLDAMYGEKVKTFLSEQAAKLPSAASISEAEKAELTEKRANAFGLFDVQTKMLGYLGFAKDVKVEDLGIEQPTRRKAGGQRGPEFGDYQISVDGRVRPKVKMTKTVKGVKTEVEVNMPLSQVNSVLAKNLNLSTRDFKNLILEANPNLSVVENDNGKPGRVIGGDWKLVLNSDGYENKVIEGEFVGDTSNEPTEDDDNTAEAEAEEF